MVVYTVENKINVKHQRDSHRQIIIPRGCWCPCLFYHHCNDQMREKLKMVKDYDEFIVKINKCIPHIKFFINHPPKMQHDYKHWISKLNRIQSKLFQNHNLDNCPAEYIYNNNQDSHYWKSRGIMNFKKKVSESSNILKFLCII